MRKTRLKPMSTKRRRENRERRKNLHAAYGERPYCQARIAGVCTGWATDGHELLLRSSGGSITDPANVMPVCRPCHRVITEMAADEAREKGFRL